MSTDLLLGLIALAATVVAPARGVPRDLDRLPPCPACASRARQTNSCTTPLVGDAVRGFRTGRVDRVPAVDFDLL